MRLLIDTDIGDDIDDVLAIGLALKKGLNLVGVTTVFRDAKKRAQIVKGVFCGAAMNVPVFAGYSEPMSKSRVNGRFYYDGCATGEISNKEEDAVDFIIDCAKKYGQDLTLLVIGAETNIAYACRKAPEIMKGIGSCVIMGGSFFQHYDEWNIACDPLAAKIVAESGMNITYVPHDITKNISIGEDNLDYVLHGAFNGVTKCVAETVAEWMRRDGWTPLLHDPVALYYCIKPELFETQKIRAKFFGEGELAGLSLNLNDFTAFIGDKNVYPEINVAVKVDSDFIVKDFMQTLFGDR